MKLQILSPVLLTTVQDLGRWGFQGQGMPVAGAMDPFALQAGNILVGNERGFAALEITVMGPSLSVAEGQGMIALTGAELDMKINGKKCPSWTALRVTEGDRISIGGPTGPGSRAYLCVSGGIDTPPIMGSRSTYLRARLGGFEGRPMAKGAVLPTGTNPPLWHRCEGFCTSPQALGVEQNHAPLRVIMGPQNDLFTDEGIETFLESEYTISNDADRMGYRFEGPTIAHREGADIVSDAIPLGSIQVPGHGKPIAMLADRQTTGGYTKIGVLVSPDIAALAQKLPGEKVRFRAVSFEEGLETTRLVLLALSKLEEERASFRSQKGIPVTPPTRGQWSVTLENTTYNVTWEEID